MLLVAGAVLAALLAVVTRPVYEVVSRDPALCFQCHLMRPAYEAWEKGPHRNVTCVECHQSSIPGDVRRLLITVFAPRTEVGPHAAVDRATCERCHAGGGDPRWSSIATRGGHAVHLADAKVACLTCHGAGVHLFVPPEKVCLECHADVTVREQSMARLHCLSCHSFLAPGPSATVRASDCLACHGEAGGEAAASTLVRRPDAPDYVPSADVVHGNLPCADCHDPHAAGGGSRDGHDCGRCHGEEAAVARAGPAGHRDCRGCHTPHAPSTDVAVGCGTCHALPHALGSAVYVEGSSGAEAPRFALAEVPHGGRCQTCHLPHRWEASLADCYSCHAELAAAAAERAPAAHAFCADCHDPHSPAPGGAACAGCHGGEGSAVALSDAGRRAPEHGRCASCHAPHAEREPAAAACTGCHAEVAAIPVEAHRACAACHAPHDVSRAGAAEKACAGCHARERGAVARAGTPAAHAACTSCHAVHPGAGRAPGPAASAAAAVGSGPGPRETGGGATTGSGPAPGSAPGPAAAGACAACHVVEAIAAAGTGLHRGSCAKCHAAHGPPGTGRTCASCHATAPVRPPRGPGAAKHADCRSCHAPHASTVSAPAGCAACHAAEAKSLAGAASPGHTDCAACHEAHDAGAPPGCARCHAAESAAAGARGPAHSDCSRCHAAHAPAIAACVSCHAPASLGGMHTHEKHRAAECASCHDAHAAPVAGRAPCVACHTGERDHEPAARRCAACHPFSAVAAASPRSAPARAP